MVWTAVGSIRGPQGVQGPQGSQGPQGNTGPSGVTTVRGATDYDDSVAPAEGQAIIWIASGGKFKPVAVQDANGRYLSNKMPLVANQIRSGTVSSSLTSDASSGGNLINLSLTGNVTLGPPTNPTDFQQLRYHCVAFGAQRTVTFGSGIIAAGGLTAGLGPYTVPRGSVLAAILEYLGNRATTADAAAPVWGLMAAAVV